MEFFSGVDHLGRPFRLGSVKRIVSLVPSLTQTVIDLGFEEKLVGITEYCPTGNTPKSVLPRRVGGTKNVSVASVVDVKPDLVLANKEENNRRTVNALERKGITVWVSDIKNVQDSIKCLSDLESLLNAKGDSLSEEARQLWNGFGSSKLRLRLSGKKGLYFIWQDPFMVAGQGTYIDSWMKLLGIKNLETRDRYPRLTTNDFMALDPDIVFLPDEPYPFDAMDQKTIGDKLLRNCQIVLLDGKMFSWFGSYMIQTFQKIQNDSFWSAPV